MAQGESPRANSAWAAAAPSGAPAVEPTAIKGNRRSPSSREYTSLANDQNCATIVRLKMPRHT